MGSKSCLFEEMVKEDGYEIITPHLKEEQEKYLHE